MTSNYKQVGSTGKKYESLKNSDLHDEDHKDNRGRGPTQRTQLIAIAMKSELLHCPERSAYVPTRVINHYENWRVGERLEPCLKANFFLPELREREMSHAA